MTPIEGSSSFAGAYCKRHVKESGGKLFGKWYLSSRNLVKGSVVETIEPIDYHAVRDPQKLAQKKQFETDIYPGLSIISEEV